MNICVHMCKYMYICVYVYICIYVYMYICIYVYMYICKYVHMFLCKFVFMYICIYVYMCICIYVYLYICTYVHLLWSFASAETPLLTVCSYTGNQKPMEIARFLQFTGPKMVLFTEQCFLYYARQKPLQIAMFLLAAAQKNAIYNVFEHPLKKHRYLRRLQQHSRRKHRYLRFFLHFRAKPSSLGNGQEHCKNQRFCPTKTAKTIPKQLWNHKNCFSGFPTRHIEKKRISKPKIEDEK